MNIGLLPLDERPVNTRYPRLVAQIGGAQLHLPPSAALSCFRRPADIPALLAWLDEITPRLDALIASFEMLGSGGLIASRISHEPAGAVLARLQAVSQLKQRRPALPVVGFNLISRVSNANSAIEEPEYWAQHGQRLYRYSQLLDRQESGQEVGQELSHLRAALPIQAVNDFIQRRLRNHTINLAALHMLSRSELDLLVLSSDDTSPYGLPSSEKRALAAWASRLGLGERLLMYPGADEVGSVLTARLLNQQAGVAPGFEVFYALPGGEAITAPYEDGPVALTVERQIRAVGGHIVAGQAERADFWLAVNPPVPRRSEWHPDFAHQERQERLPFLQQLARQVSSRLQQGQAVVVADVAYPNGADPVLVEVLFEQVDVSRLAAYGAWNTAGNTIGVALAQACASRLAVSAEQKAAQQCFLLHRFLEDWGYQQVVRSQARRWLGETHRLEEVEPAVEADCVAFIASGLHRCLEQIPGFSGFQLKENSVWLPWRRLFEVDFEIEAVPAVAG